MREAVFVWLFALQVLLRGQNASLHHPSGMKVS